jgi:DNA polymerase-3 subunit delta'
MNASALFFSRLYGHDKAKGLLSRALAADRIPHAFIFRGPDGVGKKLFASALAAALNCRDRRGAEACGACSSCKKFKSMNHPDFLVIRPEKGVIKIDQIRQLSRELTYPPYESKIRVVVLEDVQTMRREAANSLLKTLEEPPDNNVLILTAESSQEILATLVSRCQVVPFASLSIADTVAILVARGVAADTAPLLARLAEGSPGKALLFQDSDMVSIWQEAVKILSDPAIDPDRDVGVLLKLAESVAALKEELPAFLALLKIWVRDLLLGQGTTVDARKGGEDRRKSWSSAQLFAKLQAIGRAELELARNCNRNLVCEVLLFRLQ